MDYKKLKEEPLKSAVQQDFFNSYKYTQISNIDFVIAKKIKFWPFERDTRRSATPPIGRLGETTTY